jgi:hypothetical protein
LHRLLLLSTPPNKAFDLPALPPSQILWYHCIGKNVEMRSIASLMIGLAVVCLGACTPEEKNVFRSSNQQRTIGHGLSVRITNVASEPEAQPFAEEYCNARGGLARFDRMEIVSYHHVASNSALFDCVLRPGSAAATPG